MKNDYLELKKQLEEKEKKLIQKSNLELKKQVEYLKKHLLTDCIKEIEKQLISISENFSIDSATYVTTNEFNGIDFHYDIQNLIDELKVNYPDEIIEASLENFTDNYGGYIDNLNNDKSYSSYVISTSECTFIYDGSYRDGGLQLIDYDNNRHKIYNEFHGILLNELLIDKSGICGDIYGISYPNNCENIYTLKEYELPTILRAFNNEFNKNLLLDLLSFFDIALYCENNYVEYLELDYIIDSLKKQGFKTTLNYTENNDFIDSSIDIQEINYIKNDDKITGINVIFKSDYSSENNYSINIQLKNNSEAQDE